MEWTHPIAFFSFSSHVRGHIVTMISVSLRSEAVLKGRDTIWSTVKKSGFETLAQHVERFVVCRTWQVVLYCRWKRWKPTTKRPVNITFTSRNTPSTSKESRERKVSTLQPGGTQTQMYSELREEIERERDRWIYIYDFTKNVKGVSQATRLWPG